MSSDTRSLDSRVAPFARAFIRVLGSEAFRRYSGSRVPVKVTVTSTRRDPDEQRKLWDCYRKTGCSNCRRGPGCFPAAPPGQSLHAQGIAFDLHLSPPVYGAAGALWEALGLTWGGRFSDPIHFDMRRR